MEKIRFDSFVDVIWPILKKYTADEDRPAYFERLKKYFDKNGYIIDGDFENVVDHLLDSVCDTFRCYALDVNRPDEKTVKKTCDFVEEAFAEVGKVLQIKTLKSEDEFFASFKNYLQNWFDKYEGLNKEKHLLRIKKSQEYINFLKNPAKILEKLKKLPNEKALEEIEFSGGDFTIAALQGPIGQYVIDKTLPLCKREDWFFTKQDVEDILDFSLHISYIREFLDSAFRVKSELISLRKNLKLEKYYENEHFIKECKNLLSKLSKGDRYHGTRSGAVEPILKDGLYMVQEKLDSTSYRLEKFNKFQSKENLLNDLLLHRSGDGTRGEAMVFFKGDAKVKKVADPTKVDVDYSMTGLLGAEYKIDPKYIIGGIDTINMKVLYNEKLIQKEI